MKQRILTLILMVSIVIGTATIPVSVSSATNGDCGESIKWSLDNNGILTINGKGEMYDYENSSICPWYNEIDSIKSITIEDGITKIGDRAFSGCTNLVDVTLPNSLIELGVSAFLGTNLSNIFIPDTVKKINSNCFAFCYNLNDVYIGKNVEYIGEGSFSACKNLHSITIPESVNYIGDSAFSGSNLIAVYYESTKKQWDNINKSNVWNYGINNVENLVINYIVDGTIKNYASYDPNSINISIDGNYIKFDVQPQIINGRTLVPMRKIFEELGAKVDWDDSTRTAIGTKENIVVKFTIDDYTMYKNESAKALDVPAQLINGRTLIPLRAVSEAFDCQVGWDGNDSIVSIIDDSENYTMLYALNDRSKSFPADSVSEQLTVGWYTEPVQTMYAPDGRTINIVNSEVDTYIKVGWYTEPVCTMYAPDGRTINISESEVESYKKVGWYTNQKDAIASKYPKHNIRILYIDADCNSVGGIEPTIVWRNDSGKTIKYIYFTCVPYNAVGDIVSCDITRRTYAKLQSTGPYKTFTNADLEQPWPRPIIYFKRRTEPIGGSNGEYSVFAYDDSIRQYKRFPLAQEDLKHVYNFENSWNPIWYNYSVDYINITKVEVVYMDGTSETISNPPIWREIFRNASI